MAKGGGPDMGREGEMKRGRPALSFAGGHEAGTGDESLGRGTRRGDARDGQLWEKGSVGAPARMMRR